MESRLLCLEKGVESGKGTSVAYFECSSYNFDRDGNSQTKVWPYSFLVDFLVVSSRIYVSIVMVKWRG